MILVQTYTNSTRYKSTVTEPTKGTKGNEPNHATRSQTSRAGNQGIATEDGSLDQGPRSKPEALRNLLWCQTVVSRVQSLLLLSTLLGKTSSSVDELDCLLGELTQRRERTRPKDNLAEPSNTSLSAAQQLKGLRIALLFLLLLASQQLKRIGTKMGWAEGVHNHIISDVVEVHMPCLVHKRHVATPLGRVVEPCLSPRPSVASCLDQLCAHISDHVMPVLCFWFRGLDTGMSMAEMTVAVPATAVATGVCLVGEVRGARSGGSNQDWCSGHAEELGQEEVEAQPRDVVGVRDDQPAFGRGHEEREESIGGALQHADIAAVPR